MRRMVAAFSQGCDEATVRFGKGVPNPHNIPPAPYRSLVA
jgi:hypothetical protein